LIGLSGNEGHQQSRANCREQETQQSARPREKETLGQELAYEPRSTGAERQAHRDLLLTRGRPSQQQIGHVEARDQQHERHDGHQNQERLGKLAPDLTEPLRSGIDAQP
jgi:hypothetical protein